MREDVFKSVESDVRIAIVPNVKATRQKPASPKTTIRAVILRSSVIGGLAGALLTAGVFLSAYFQGGGGLVLLSYAAMPAHFLFSPLGYDPMAYRENADSNFIGLLLLPFVTNTLVFLTIGMVAGFTLLLAKGKSK